MNKLENILSELCNRPHTLFINKIFDRKFELIAKFKGKMISKHET
jgi:hypothetical protein